jgi:hypothetical protein
MSSPAPDPSLAAVEAALAGLAPRPGNIDRDQLLFRAGQASVRRRGWLWPTAAALSTTFAAALGLLLLLRPEPSPVERVVVVKVVEPAPTPPPAPEPPAPLPSGALVWHVDEPGPVPSDYLRLRDQMIRWGADALPSAAPVSAPPPAPELDRLRGSLWPGWFPRSNASRSGDSL